MTPRDGRATTTAMGACVLALAVAAALCLAGWLTVIAWECATAQAAVTFDRLLEGTLAAAGVPVSLWLAASITSSTWQILRGRPRARISPVVVHRLVAVLLGTAVAAAPMAAHAQVADPGWSPQIVESAAAPAPGWTPTAADVPPPNAEPAASEVVGNQRATDVGSVVVLRGDSLWDIAARQLGPQASAAEVAAAWPLWWEQNRDVIGSDPDLILPGQQLRVPPV